MWRKPSRDRRAELPATEPRPGEDFLSLFITAPDGRKIHVRRYGPRFASAVPVVCLPALARTAADFHPLAMALAGDPNAPRAVLAVDYRGHGRSDYDRNPAKYTLPVDVGDVAAVLTALEIPRAVFVGTSHGGLAIMMLGTSRPTMIAGVILNDIGPVAEAQGLLRMKRYIGKLPGPRSFEEGAQILLRVFHAQFPKLAPQEWIAFARRTWREQDGQLVLDYDAKLAQSLERANLEHPPALWSQFDTLGHVPVMVIRGGNSDVLAPATLDAMLARRAELEILVVPDQGHPPLLTDPKLIARIVAFVASCDAPAAVG
jgi:pimeloyl-ACP methyl ester carboxylesterase